MVPPQRLVALSLAVLLASFAIPVAQADPQSCSYEQEYLIGGSWEFVCDAGWSVPTAFTSSDLTGSDQPCIEITEVDAYTIRVSFPTLCIGDDLSMALAAVGILYVFDAARSS